MPGREAGAVAEAKSHRRSGPLPRSAAQRAGAAAGRTQGLPFAPGSAPKDGDIFVGMICILCMYNK